MYCPNCGKMIPDGVHICPECSAPLDYASNDGNMPGAGQVFDANMHNGAGNQKSTSADGNPGLGVIREMGKSTMYLVAIIAYTASIVLTFVSTGRSASSLTNSFGQFMNMMPDSYGSSEMEQYLNMISPGIGAGTFITTLITNIPSILTAVGLWLIYKEAKKRKKHLQTIIHLFN